MSQVFAIHPHNPQSRLIEQVATIVRRGGVIVYPTDACYALGCHIGDKAAADRMRQLRQIDAHYHLTLVCRNLAEVGTYAAMDNAQHRMLKMLTPGSYTFILPATREVPKRLQHPKQSTIGVRIPENKIALALLEALGEPLLSTTLMLPGSEVPPTDTDDIRLCLAKQVDLIIAGGSCGILPTTVADLTAPTPNILRVGKGALTPFGL